MLIYIVAALACIPVLFRIPKVQYYARFIVFLSVILLCGFYYAIELGIRGRSYKNAWRFKKAFWLAGYIIGLRPVVKDAHLLNFDKPCIYVANHQSCIDVASLVDVWPERCTIVSKASLLLAGPVGLIMWLSKVICINRSDHSSAIAIMKRAAEAATHDQVSVYLFPEGTRSLTGSLLPFKKGTFHMAIQCQFPIQPIVVSPYGRFINHENKVFKAASYTVQVLPQISTAGMTEDQVDDLLNETRAKMLEAFNALKEHDPAASCSS